MALIISIEDPRADDIRALLDAHLAFARAVTPPEDVHALDIDGLLDPAVTFFGARIDGEVVGVGALKQLDQDHAELKSMHTVETARRRGIGRAVVGHLLSVAGNRNYRRVSLETGTTHTFAPARRLYEEIGFGPCEPFGDHAPSPGSVCMTFRLPDAHRGNR